MTQTPARVYQRHRQTWNRLVLAAGWAMLYVLCETTLSAHPALQGARLSAQWRAVLAASILIGGLWKPAAGYLGFMLAVAYPLYGISPYVMALGVATLLLFAPLVALVRLTPVGSRVRAASPETGTLTAALLVLAAPLLAPAGLPPVLALVAGLWWGGAAGAAVGGLSALWLKACAGMAGHSIDLWAINGWTMSVAPVYERFHAADSLQTLRNVVAPLWSDPAGWLAPAGPETSVLLSTGSWGPGAQILLFNLLQVAAWAAAGYVTGALRERLEESREGLAAPASALATQLKQGALSLGPGLLAIWAGYVAVPVWLQMTATRWLRPLWLPSQVVLAGLVAWGLDGSLRYLGQPVLEAGTRLRPGGIRAAKARRPAVRAGWSTTRRQRRAERRASAARRAGEEALSALPEQARKASRDQDKEGIIMIEID